MEQKDNNSKGVFSSVFKKASDLGKKAAEETKKFVDQTKENIHEQKAKKYLAVSEKDFKTKTFKIPSIIMIEEDGANSEFIKDEKAIGWIEEHKSVSALHFYASFAKKCGITFIPTLQTGNAYYRDNFDEKKYISSNAVFGRATEEKLAELNNIAYCLGAKHCSIEMVEEDSSSETKSFKLSINGAKPASSLEGSVSAKRQSGKTLVDFEGHDNPEVPDLKWFEHDDNIKNLIKMRCNKAIKSSVLELSGSASATMSKSIACAIDDVLNICGNLSMEKQSIKEHNTKLMFEIYF